MFIYFKGMFVGFILNVYVYWDIWVMIINDNRYG